MKGHNKFYAELTKSTPKYHQLLPLTYSSEKIPFLLMDLSVRVYVRTSVNRRMHVQT